MATIQKRKAILSNKQRPVARKVSSNNTDDILKQAIVEAKMVTQVALKNAKTALTEAFTPKLKSLLKAKINKEIEGDELEGMTEEEDFDLDDEITEEDELSFEDEPVTEEDEMEMDSDEITEEELEDAFGDEEMNEEDELSDDDLELEGDEMEIEDEPVTEEDEISDEELEQALAEVEDEDLESDDLSDVPEDELDITDDEFGDESDELEMEDLDLDGEDELDITNEGEESDDLDIDLDEPAPTNESKRRLAKAMKVIKFQKNKLNEVTLLNTKSLFVTKLLKSFELTKDEKMKVINNFDKARNLREAKLVFQTLTEALKNRASKKINSAKKSNVKRITEGLASRSVMSTRPKNIINNDSNEMVNRMQLLAGIKKTN